MILPHRIRFYVIPPQGKTSTSSPAQAQDPISHRLTQHLTNLIYNISIGTTCLFRRFDMQPMLSTVNTETELEG
jgi:hypothetical protein